MQTLRTTRQSTLAMLLALLLGAMIQTIAAGYAHADEIDIPDIIVADVPAVEVSNDSGETEADPAAEPEKPRPIGVRYSIRVQCGDWTEEASLYRIVGTPGSGVRMTNMRIELDTGTLSGSIKYRALLANGTWTKWKKNGAALGAHNNITAIQVILTGEIAQTYDVVYRTYVDSIGWQRRMRNGESAGVTTGNQRIEALRVALVKKSKRAGWINEAGTWSFYKAGKPVSSTWLSTAESPIESTLVGKHRYWLDAQGALALDRYVLPSNANDAQAGFAAYATSAGYPFVGKRVTSEGITLTNKKGKLYAKSRWLKTSAFDGAEQRYRLKGVGDYAVVQTGFFKVDGKKYYGFEDDRGYLMRSTIRCIGDKWFEANASGVLKNVNKQTKKHIERYVKWAIDIANDNSHGYTQALDGRWGPDYDCSSLVASALLAAGFPDSGAVWTGNMKDCLTSIGFVWHTDLSKLKRGDIMLVHADYRQHTEIYIGKNQLVGAHIAETGGIYGVTGDQTGNEISIGRYYNAPWQGFLRYRS